MKSLHRLALLIVCVMLTQGCGRRAQGPLPVALIGDASAVEGVGVRLPPAGQVLRAATIEGLVGFDEEGRVVPAIAQRWIITDDGASYIFRLRDGTWPDGTAITAETAASALRKALAALKGTALGLDLMAISQVRVMATKVIEIDLIAPEPDLLTLLAQPELGLPRAKRGSGPMAVNRENGQLILSLIPPEKRGLPPQENFARRSRTLLVELVSAARGVARFNDGYVDALMGGRIDSLPLAQTAGLSRGNVQLDPVIGLFGIMIDSNEGFLAEPPNREALALAIDRDALIAAFNIGGWQPTTRIVAAGIPGDLGTVGERWVGMAIAQRRALAAERLARWKATGQSAPSLRITMPGGPGSKLVFERISADFAAIGLNLSRVAEGKPAELRLIDVAARYGRPAWFLNQLACSVHKTACNQVGDERLAEARAAGDPRDRAALLGEAEAEITAANGYIPLARPLRWSLVRSNVAGFSPNVLGWHPLPPLAVIPR
jgi:ABC-type transport system substrate-binding protein